MRAMTNHWLNYLEEADVAEAWRAESTSENSVLSPRYLSDPWKKFAEAMSKGLSTYTVRVEYTVPFASGDSFTSHRPRPDLFSAMCL